MVQSIDEVMRWGMPFAFKADLSAAGFTSVKTVVTPATTILSQSKDASGGRFLTRYGLVVTGIHIFAGPKAGSNSLSITEYDGTNDYPILNALDSTVQSWATFELFHPCKIGSVSGTTVSQGSVIRIVTSATWATGSFLRIEGFQTTEDIGTGKT